jgi:hypothetical protein
MITLAPHVQVRHRARLSQHVHGRRRALQPAGVAH